MKFAIFFLILNFYQAHFTPLEDFVNNNDDISVVSRVLLDTINQGTYTTYKLNFTTLKWFDDSFSTASTWWHYVYVNIPQNLNPSYPVYLHIDHGQNDIDDAGTNGFIGGLSEFCNCITVTMRQVPNQPIKFSIDPSNEYRYEDNLIAGTFYLTMNYFSQYPDTYTQIPLLFPMTKAVKRGMDIITDSLNELGVQFSGKFILSGVSKRGWTSYLTAAVDQRVMAIIPIVFDLVNLHQNLHDQFKSFGGGYSFAIGDYLNFEITKKLDTVEEYELFKLVDPYYYLDKLRGKLVYTILATGDEFMIPSNLKNFIQELKIQTTVFVRLLDTDHSLVGKEEDLSSSIKSFLYLLSTGTLPDFRWKFVNNLANGVIKTSITNLDAFKTLQLSAYIAKTLNNKKLDFRKRTIDGPQQIKWLKSKVRDITSIKPIVYTNSFSVKRDAKKYVGFYVEARLKFIDSEEYFTMSTNINIVPEFYPVGDCEGEECTGKLV